MMGLAIRKAWIGIGIVLIAVAFLQLIRLGTDSYWSGAAISLVTLLIFGIVLLLSAWRQLTSKLAHGLLQACLAVMAIYSASYLLMVGWEFGGVWLAVDLAALFFALFSIFVFARK